MKGAQKGKISPSNGLAEHEVYSYRSRYTLKLFLVTFILLLILVQSMRIDVINHRIVECTESLASI